MSRRLIWFWLLAAGAARGEVIDVREGTNLSLAIHPDGEFMVVDLLGGLWQLPVTGGGARALVAAGSGVAQPRFDPAGDVVVFQRWRDGQWDVWQLTLATASMEPVVESGFNEREPEFSADGRQIVFAGDRGGRYSLWSHDIATGSLRQLTDEAGDARFPSIGAEGALAYVNVLGESSAIRLHEGGPRGRTVVESSRRLDAPSWRPGGGVLVVNQRVEGSSSDLSLFIDADEPIWRRMTTAEDVFVGRTGWLSAEEYVYAADGAIWRRGIGSMERKRILIFAGVDVEELEPTVTTRRIDAEGPHPIQGINGWTHHAPSERSAFTALGDLWLVDDGEISRLTDDSFADTEPQFTADGDWLVFSSDRSGESQIWRLRIDSGQLLQLSSERGSVFGPRVSGDGRYVAYLESDGFDRTRDAAVRLIALERPFESVALATGLVDAGNLAWQGSYLRLTARDAPSGEPYPHVFETAATGGAFATGSADLGPDELIGHPDLVWTPAMPESDLVIQAGRLFDGAASEYRYHVDIHIRGQRITDIVSRDRLALPGRTIDARDLTVVPGLIDVHAHLGGGPGSAIGRLLLGHGITTVGDVTAEWLPSLELAETWESGQQPGPRIVISPPGSRSESGFPGASPVFFSPSRRILGGLRHSLADQWSRDGHPVTDLRSIRTGDGVEAPPRIALSTLGRTYADVYEQLRASRVYLATGLGALRSSAAAARIPALGTAFQRTLRSSGRVAIGTDAPFVDFGSGFHDELALLAQSGMPADQILRYATAGGAVALGLSLDIGMLERGRLADLLVIDGDPLQDIDDLRRIQAVVRGGVWHDTASLALSP